MELVNLTQNYTLAERVITAQSFCQRSIGLLGKRDWAQEKTLWIPRCNSIHTFFMKFAIDAVFVNKDLKVTKIYRNLAPGKITLPDLKATSVFEFSSAHNRLANLKLGDQLYVGS